MSAELEFALFTVAAPLATAAATALLLARVAPATLAERYALGAALAAGFAVGYLLLPDWAPLVPEQHWHWLPYVGAASVLAAIGMAQGVSLPERWLAFALLALVVAWQLTPLWPDLSPPRTASVPLLAGYLLLITGLLTALPDRLIGRTLVALLAASAAATAVVVALGVSGKLGQVAAAAAAGIAGCFAATCLATLARRASEGARHPLATAIRGLIPVYAVLAGGSSFAGTIEPLPPLPIILVAPATPLALWLFAWGPLARLKGPAAIAAQCLAVAIPLLVAIAWMMLGGQSDGWSN